MNPHGQHVIPFSMRPASAAWEIISLPGQPAPGLTMWFRPQHLPNGVIFNLPADQLQRIADRRRLTLQAIIGAAGLTPPEVAAISIYGGEWLPATAFHQLLAQPVPEPAPGCPSQILVLAHLPVTMPVMPIVATPGGMPLPSPAGPAAEAMPEFDSFAGTAATDLPTDPKLLRDRIDADWQTCLQLERQLGTLRQKLSAALSKLGTLDRDLAPQERLAAQREDVDAWQDARRWIRDASSKVHRFIKSHDVGITSAAGRRSVMEQMHQRCCAGMMSPAEITALYREMETYRRLLTHLQSGMNSALTTASQDGEGRARRVLQRINAKLQDQRRQWRSGK